MSSGRRLSKLLQTPEWERVRDGLWRAKTAFGEWYIRRLADRDFVVDRIRRDGLWSSEHPFAFLNSLPKKQYPSLHTAKDAFFQFLCDDVTKTAYHEAGHLTAALLLNLPLRADCAATIIPDEAWTYKGFVFTTDWARLAAGKVRSRTLLEKHCVCCLAGRAADIVRRGEWFERAMAAGPTGGDYATVNLLLEMLTSNLPSEWSGLGFVDDELKAYLLVLELRAARLVKDSWVVIEALAWALLDRGNLSAQHANTIASCFRNRR